MPETPSAVTAKKVQDAITAREAFLFLATANANASRWCPWEIGYADSSLRKMFIIPTTDGLATYGSEYLELYPRIDIGRAEARSGLALFPAGRTTCEWLSSASFR